jgi:hypothetical protein
MENQYTAETLKEAIKELEIKQAEEGQLLKKQLLITYENLKPINILRNLVKDFSSSDNYKQDFLEIVAGMTSGFITKKIVVGRSKNPILKLMGLAIQFGMTTIVSNKFSTIKNSIVHFLSRFVKEKESE